MKQLWKKALPLLLCLVTLLCVVPAVHAEQAEEEKEGMKVSEEFLTVLKEMEGFSAYPYWDASQWTIGYGTKCPDNKLAEYKKTGITEETALKMLDEELASVCEEVNAFAEKHELTWKQHQFDAIVSFTYNCGGSWMGELNGNFNTAVRSGDTGSLFMYGICLYSTSAGNYILIQRRLCEANMYINGVYKSYTEEESYPENFKWIFLNGGGAVPRYPIFAYDSKKAPKIEVRFSSIPTGKTEDGKTFVYDFAGWYTSDGKKITKADSKLENGQILYARWKDPDGKVVELPTGTPVAKQKISVTSSSVNVRKGPGTFYGKSGNLTKGTKLTLTEVYSANSATWGKTNKGWVSLSYTDYAPETDLPQTGKVNANGVNYRTGPGTSYKKKGEKDKGDAVTIVALSDSGSWGKMSDGNWILLKYVTYDKDRIKKAQLIKKPKVLDYKSHLDPLRTEGSVVLLTYADGRQVAKTIARGDVKDTRRETSKKVTLVAKYGSKSVSFPITITKPTKLKITGQPEKTAVDMGDKVEVSVKAKGDGLKYQWYIAKAGSSSYKKVGCTSATYSDTMDTALSGSKVYCKITDKYGESVKTKKVAITGNMVITKQPKKASAVLGKKVSTTVKVDGVGLKYQWFVADPGKSYKKVSATGATYSVTMKEAISGRKVYCKITDKYGNEAKTKTVTLTAQLKLTEQPANVSVAAGKKATVSVNATGVGLKYKWYYAKSGSTSYKKAGTTKDTYSVTMSDKIAGRSVYCVITDQHGNEVKTEVVTLTLKTAAANKAKITKQPKNASAKIGSKVSASVKATGKGLKYQWYVANPGKSFKKSSVTGKTYSVTMKKSVSGRQVYCVITDKYGNSVKTKTVTLTAKVAITKQPVKDSEKVGKKATATVQATGVGLKYQWYVANPGKSFSKSSLTGKTYSVTMKKSISGRRVYCRITDAYGNSVKTKTVTLTAKGK